MCQTPPCLMFLSPSSPLPTHPVPPVHFTISCHFICEFYSLLLCHTGTSVRLHPPPGYWYTSFFFMQAGPGSLHELAVSAFSRSPLGRANTLSFLIPSLNPPCVYLKCSSHISPCFSALAFPFFLSFLLLLSCTSQTSM